MSIRAATLAAVLALCAAPARAGSLTYDFIEGPGSPHPGTIGASITFASPPAEPNSFWATFHTTDVLDFQILDASIAPIDSYMTNFIIPSTIASDNGQDLDSGSFFGRGPNFTGVSVLLFSGPNQDAIVAPNNVVTGDFVVASVPEPSSLALAGIATLAGLGAWARRRGRGSLPGPSIAFNAGLAGDLAGDARSPVETPRR
jgi:hypothetical protein